MAKKNYLKTPKGVAKFPHLNAPDTKFKEAGEYHVVVTFDSSEPKVKQLMAETDEMATQQFDKTHAELLAKGDAKAKKAAKDLQRSDPYLLDEETGMVEFGFKMGASGVSKKNGKPWTRKPALFDAKGVPLADDVKVGGGSVIIVAYDPFMYHNAAAKNAGVSLRMEAVQVIELKEFGGRDAAGYGFGQEEGYTSKPKTDNPFEDAQDDEDTEEDSTEEKVEDF